MAKPESITYDSVEQAANELRGAGITPTVRLVRQKVGGSNTTILRHLNVWKAANPPARHQVREIPAELVSALETTLGRIEATARAEIQGQLVDAQNTLDDVTGENEELQERNAELQGQNSSLASERDRLKGQVAEQASELQSLRDAVAREQAAAEGARVEQAKAQLRVEGADARLTELAERERALRSELTTAQAEHTSTRDARVLAERDAAVNRAQLEAERGVRAAAESRIAELQSELQAAAPATGRAAAAEASTTELRATVAMLQGLLERASVGGTDAAGEGGGAAPAGARSTKR